MKIEQKKEVEFVPVVITLQSQEEVDILKDLVGRVVRHGKGRIFTGELFGELYNLSEVPTDTYFTGEIFSN